MSAFDRAHLGGRRLEDARPRTHGGVLSTHETEEQARIAADPRLARGERCVVVRVRDPWLVPQIRTVDPWAVVRPIGASS